MPRLTVRTVLAETAPQAPALVDGRQSPAALAIRRGVCRRLRAEGYALLPELPLASGRRADLVGLGRKAEIVIVEIKSSLADFQADRKWRDYLAFADRFYFATCAQVPCDVFPAEAGLILADAFGAEILRESAVSPLAGGRRKEMLTRLARAGANRLHDLEDPEGGF
ncbi:MmcB family DNA repair protein [Afifella pfennigii]|uniref:MmcB family DNA repair protein n=1 Tax=Afifella pfennigii TaxID=209897 RepID=UPI00047D190C|nr:MmcB family DNA repair protein [Afifella pfennigii]